MIPDSPVLSKLTGKPLEIYVKKFEERTKEYRKRAYPRNFVSLFLGLLRFPTGWFSFRGVLYCFTGWKHNNNNLDVCGQMIAKIVLEEKDILLCCPIRGQVFVYPRGDEFPHIPIGRLWPVRWLLAWSAFFRLHQVVQTARRILK